MQEYSIFQAVFTTGSVEAFLDRIREIAERNGVNIIFFNADFIAGQDHIRAAMEHALRSFAKGSPIAKTFEMEALVYSSGSRQCLDAVRFGIHTGQNRCYLVIAPPDKKTVRDLEAEVRLVTDDWEAIDVTKRETLMKLFSITPEELAIVGTERIKELVIERVALLEVYR